MATLSNDGNLHMHDCCLQKVPAMIFWKKYELLFAALMNSVMILMQPSHSFWVNSLGMMCLQVLWIFKSLMRIFLLFVPSDYNQSAQLPAPALWCLHSMMLHTVK